MSGQGNRLVGDPPFTTPIMVVSISKKLIAPLPQSRLPPRAANSSPYNAPPPVPFNTHPNAYPQPTIPPQAYHPPSLPSTQNPSPHPTPTPGMHYSPRPNDVLLGYRHECTDVPTGFAFHYERHTTRIPIFGPPGASYNEAGNVFFLDAEGRPWYEGMVKMCDSSYRAAELVNTWGEMDDGGCCGGWCAGREGPGEIPWGERDAAGRTFRLGW